MFGIIKGELREGFAVWKPNVVLVFVGDFDGVLRGFGEEENDLFVGLAALAKVAIADGVAESGDEVDFGNAGFFGKFADGGLFFGFASFDMAFGKVPMAAGVV